MSYLPVDPIDVLVVGGTDAELDRFDRATAGTVVTVANADVAADRLVERADVGCVVVVEDAVESVATALDVLRDAAERIPVVVYGDGDTAALTEVASRSWCRYVPRSVAPDQVGAAVSDAVEGYRERRVRHAESELFRTLRRDENTTIQVKDERARHVEFDADGEDNPVPRAGKTDVELANGPFLEEARTAYDDDLTVIETGEPLYDVVYVYDADGNTVWSMTTKLPWIDADGTVRGLVGYSENITEQKNAEIRLKRLQSRFDQFAGYVSHDIRTPLQIAYGAMGRARDGDSESLDKVKEALERIEQIVEDFDDLSSEWRRVSADPADPDSADALIPTSRLEDVLRDVWDVISPPAATLSVEMPSDTVIRVRESELRPLVENLLKNAVDHAGPDVHVTVGRTAEGGFFVEDDGPGIDEEIREDVVQAGFTTDHDGRGLGLQIVTDTIEKLGWELAIADGSAGGARFEISGCAVIDNWTDGPDCIETVPIEFDRDFGDLSSPGRSAYDAEAGAWTVASRGEDMWWETDEYHFAYGVADGPCRIQGRITDFEVSHPYAKAGFMIRDGTDAHAAYGVVGTSGDHGSLAIGRRAAGEPASNDIFREPDDAFPWYRLEYDGARVTSFISRDGAEWRPIAQHRVAFEERPLVGLAVTGHSDTDAGVATFRDVEACTLPEESDGE